MKTVDGLSKLLANTYVLYLKTQNFHWNVEGEWFHTLHVLFEEQYKALAESVDVIAERIRALGAYAPASFSKYQKLASLKEEDHVPQAKEMIKELIHDREMMVKHINEILPVFEKDAVTTDLLVEQLENYEKSIWMLKSLLK